MVIEYNINTIKLCRHITNYSSSATIADNLNNNNEKIALITTETRTIT
jgi:hypothetical protein